MCGNRGFTLLELVLAIAMLAVGFGVIFEVLSRARLEHSYTHSLKEDLLELNSRLVEGRKEGLEEEKKVLEDYPELEEVSYRLGSAEIFTYQLKR